jgi:hypothetical protein
MNKVKALVIIPAVLVMAAACSKSATSGPKPLTVSLKEFSVTLSTLTAPAGETTFSVSNSGTTAHEFVVLKTDTPAGDFPVTSFEGESERFDEDAAGENVAGGMHQDFTVGS